MWKAVTDVFSGLSVRFEYKSGYYESTSPEDWQYKCNPGEASCTFTIVGSAMSLADSNGVMPPDYGEAMMTFDDDENLCMIIRKSSLDSATFNTNYADGYMSIPGNWELQNGLSSALGLPNDYVIPEGNYTIESMIIEDEEMLVVRF